MKENEHIHFLDINMNKIIKELSKINTKKELDILYKKYNITNIKQKLNLFLIFRLYYGIEQIPNNKYDSLTEENKLKMQTEIFFTKTHEEAQFYIDHIL